MKAIELGLGRGVRIGFFRYAADRIDARTNLDARVEGAPERDGECDDTRRTPLAHAGSLYEQIDRSDESDGSREVSENVVARENHTDDLAAIGRAQHREQYRCREEGKENYRAEPAYEREQIY